MGPWANPTHWVGSHGTQRGGGLGRSSTLGQPTHWVGSHGTAGGEYGREEGSQGVGPPWPPPLTLGFILVSFTGKFTNILGLIA